ncbi:MAG: radical SAM family heme chaperone HemW [OM182 bacterium]|uniref:Heme chaperone HemW n=1 Tax=OM182 bacterium TaxID=2510334 RepID=A0A520S768_9GAMM|nr:MAG: radical SAM family heme chaperone HemW [OM182 bacterium]
MLEQPPLSLYMHVPWCIRKCPYCDFNSHAVKSDIPEQAYVDALCQDFELEAARLGQSSSGISSIFIGGGTPSLLSAAAYERLLSHIDAVFGLESAAEITLEANPGTAEAKRFLEYRAAGINRLSIGVQSFNEAHLKTLGRTHSGNDARRAIEYCTAAGFDNFNLDLMHGLPGQTEDEALDDIETALNFEPPHLSWYQLTIEPNTEFFSKPPALPAEGLLDTIHQRGQQLLESRGYGRYEVSAFCQPGRESRHNLNYWLFGDYLGIGAGAHGKLTQPDNNLILRTRKKKQPDHYLASELSRTAEATAVAPEDRALEFLLNGLRLVNGFSIQEFETRTGVTFSQIGKRVEYLASLELLNVNHGRVRATEHGYRVLNSLLEEFIE